MVTGDLLPSAIVCLTSVDLRQIKGGECGLLSASNSTNTSPPRPAAANTPSNVTTAAAGGGGGSGHPHGGTGAGVPQAAAARRAHSPAWLRIQQRADALDPPFPPPSLPPPMLVTKAKVQTRCGRALHYGDQAGACVGGGTSIRDWSAGASADDGGAGEHRRARLLRGYTPPPDDVDPAWSGDGLGNGAGVYGGGGGQDKRSGVGGGGGVWQGGV